jgi:hypothetical protein
MQYALGRGGLCFGASDLAWMIGDGLNEARLRHMKCFGARVFDNLDTPIVIMSSLIL